MAGLRLKTTLATGFGQVGVPDVTLHVSRDGGRTFRETGAVPKPSTAQYTADPSVVFDRSGRLFVGYLVSGSDRDDGIFVVRSDDVGDSWAGPATRVARESRSAQGCTGHDKPYVAIGRRPPSAPRASAAEWVYVAWHTVFWAGADCTQQTPDVHAMLSRSADGGRTFSPPNALSADMPSMGAIPAVGPDGTVHVTEVFEGKESCLGSYTVDVGVKSSRDGGASFRATHALTTCMAGSPAPSAGLYYTHSLPTIAVSPRTGAVVVASVHRDGADDAVVVRAMDGRGGAWVERSRIPRLPGIVQELPWLAYSPSGRLVALYLGQAPGGLYDAYLVSSRDEGRTWTEPVRVSSLPSVGNVRSFADTWSLGHYLGLAVGTDEIAHPVWPDIRSTEGSMVNLWTRRVALVQAAPSRR